MFYTPKPSDPLEFFYKNERIVLVRVGSSLLTNKGDILVTRDEIVQYLNVNFPKKAEYILDIIDRSLKINYNLFLDDCLNFSDRTSCNYEGWNQSYNNYFIGFIIENLKSFTNEVILHKIHAKYGHLGKDFLQNHDNDILKSLYVYNNCLKDTKERIDFISQDFEKNKNLAIIGELDEEMSVFLFNEYAKSGSSDTRFLKELNLRSKDYSIPNDIIEKIALDFYNLRVLMTYDYHRYVDFLHSKYPSKTIQWFKELDKNIDKDIVSDFYFNKLKCKVDINSLPEDTIKKISKSYPDKIVEDCLDSLLGDEESLKSYTLDKLEIFNKLTDVFLSDNLLISKIEEDIKNNMNGYECKIKRYRSEIQSLEKEINVIIQNGEQDIHSSIGKESKVKNCDIKYENLSNMNISDIRKFYIRKFNNIQNNISDYEKELLKELAEVKKIKELPFENYYNIENHDLVDLNIKQSTLFTLNSLIRHVEDSYKESIRNTENVSKIKRYIKKFIKANNVEIDVDIDMLTDMLTDYLFYRLECNIITKNNITIRKTESLECSKYLSIENKEDFIYNLQLVQLYCNKLLINHIKIKTPSKTEDYLGVINTPFSRVCFDNNIGGISMNVRSPYPIINKIKEDKNVSPKQLLRLYKLFFLYNKDVKNRLLNMKSPLIDDAKLNKLL